MASNPRTARVAGLTVDPIEPLEPLSLERAEVLADGGLSVDREYAMGDATGDDVTLGEPRPARVPRAVIST